MPDLADDVLAQPADLADLGVGEAVPLGLGDQVGVQAFGGGQLVGDLLDQEELVDEPGSIFVASKTSSWVAPARIACMTVR